MYRVGGAVRVYSSQSHAGCTLSSYVKVSMIGGGGTLENKKSRSLVFGIHPTGRRSAWQSSASVFHRNCPEGDQEKDGQEDVKKSIFKFAASSA
jgi:hypothetical protein